MPTITSTVSCKLFDSNGHSNNSKEVKKPFWMPDTVYDQNYKSYETKLEAADLWKSYFNIDILVQQIVQSYIYKLYNVQNFNFLDLKNYSDFVNLIDNRPKEYIEGMITTEPEN